MLIRNQIKVVTSDKKPSFSLSAKFTATKTAGGKFFASPKIRGNRPGTNMHREVLMLHNKVELRLEDQTSSLACPPAST